MDWGQHISDLSSKATKTLGSLRRNLAFAPRSTKEVAYKTLVRPKKEYAAPIWSSYSKLQINQVEKVQRTAARWTCRRWRNTSSVGKMLDELEWPSLEARRVRSSLLLFHKIHSGAVSIEKDKYLTPAHSLKSTRSSHSAQYCRYQTYNHTQGAEVTGQLRVNGKIRHLRRCTLEVQSLALKRKHRVHKMSIQQPICVSVMNSFILT